MKKTQLKDALRNIGRQKVSYISIILIVTLGVTAFLGINYSSAAMQKAGNDFYNQNNFQDMEMVATLGITEDDVEAVRAVEGVLDAEGVHSTTAVIEKKKRHIDVNVFSMTERLNQPVVIEGTLPQTENECALEETVMEKTGLKVGDTVSLNSGSGKTPKYLKQQEFTVTAKIRYADHIKEASFISSTVLVTRDAFDMRDEFDPDNRELYYTRLAVRLDCGEREVFSDRYFESIQETEEALQELSEQRAKVRDRSIEERISGVVAQKEQELAEAKQELEDGRRELDEGRERLTDAAAQIGENRGKLTDAKEQLDDARAQLDDAKKQLEDSRRTLDDAKAQLEEKGQELADAKQQLDEGKRELDEAKVRLDEGHKQLEDARQQLEDAHAQLDQAKTEYENAINEMIHEGAESIGLVIEDQDQEVIDEELSFTYETSLDQELKARFVAYGLSEEDADKALEASRDTEEYQQANEGYDRIKSSQEQLDESQQEYDEAMSEYDSAYASYEDGDEGTQIEYDSAAAELARAQAEYDAGMAKYEAGMAEYEAALAEYEAKEKEYQESEEKYTQGLEEYETKEQEYQSSLAEYEEGASALADAEEQYDASAQELAEGEDKYRSGMDEYLNSVNRLDSKKQQLENVDQCRWFQFDITSNLGYVSLDMNAGNLGKLGRSFALLFVVVGAMVCYATIGRMVDEQRKLVGSSKALGLFSSEIFKKYVFFGVSAVFIGAVLGIIAAYFGVQKAVLMGNSASFAFGEAEPVMVVGTTIAVLIFGLLMGLAATYFACAKLLRSTAVELMKGSAPKVFKGGAGKGGSLYSRLIIRNMLSDLKRVAVTIVSVAGCCSLLVIGFTLRSSVDKVIERQYDEIVTYDNNIVFSTDRTASAAADISGVLEEYGCDYTELSKEYITCRFGQSNDVAEMYIIAPQSVEGYFDLRDAWTNEKIDPSSWQQGVLIQKRVAEVCGIKAGDSLTLYDTNAKEHQAVVAGVFDNYIGRMMFMSNGYYEELFGTPVRNSQFFVKRNGADADALKKAVSKIEGYKSFGWSDSQKDFFSSISVILGAVIAGMIFMAAMMASVVLLNLTNMYLTQKKRELAIMRINGFTVGQTIGYMVRETVATTVIGIILGIGGGAVLALQMIHSMEKPNLQLVRDADYIAWLLAALITGVFAFIINFIVLRKVKGLKLTDLAG